MQWLGGGVKVRRILDCRRTFYFVLALAVGLTLIPSAQAASWTGIPSGGANDIAQASTAFNLDNNGSIIKRVFG